MKTPSRIHRNGNTKPALVQPPKEHGIKNGGYVGNEPICLTIFDHVKDEDVAGCDITAAEWAQLKKWCAETEISVGEFFKIAICKLLPPLTPSEQLEVARLLEADAFKIRFRHGAAFSPGRSAMVN